MRISTRKVIIAIALLLVLVSTIELQNVDFAEANPIFTKIPPKVNMPEMSVNATIYGVAGGLWAKIDAEYTMHTVYAYGDTYLTKNKGMGLLVDPSPYVTVTVTENTLEAHYPLPLNATNISVSVDGREVELQQDARGHFHILDANQPEINWTVSPVPRDFLVEVHYEQPISKTTQAYSYLGDFAFTLPLYGRYGCSSISYPLYDWAGYPPTEYHIQIVSTIPDLKILSIDNRGTLIPLNYTVSTENANKKMEITFSHGSEETTAIQGAVAVFNAHVEETGLSSTDIAVVASTFIIVVAVGLLVYIKKRRKQHNQFFNV